MRFGLLAIKNVGINFANAVVLERKSKPYSSFDDFVSRLSGKDINKRTLESLIKCGVFDSLGVPRSALLLCFEGIIEGEQDRHRSNITGQLDMFSMGMQSKGTSSGYDYPKVEEYPIKELLLLEKESSGMYLSGHMIDTYSKHASTIKTDKISDILDAFEEEVDVPDSSYRDKSEVTVVGIISSKRTKVTKSGDAMAFLTLEDKTAEIGILVFTKQYSQYSDELYTDNAVCIKGRISYTEGEAPEIILSSVERLRSNEDYREKIFSPNESNPQKNGRIYVKVSSLNDPRIGVIYRLANFNKGEAGVALYDVGTKKYSVLTGIKIAPSEKVMSKLAEAFGKDSVVYK